LDLPRERFVPPDQAELAYSDLDLPLVGEPGRTSPRCLLRPMNLAKLIQAAEIGGADRVLDIGAASGYAAAVLARLAREVVALEEDPALAAFAGKSLAGCKVLNASVVTGPLTEGWPPQAPYDVILLEGASEIAPRMLFAQLRDGGRLACIEGRGLSGKATIYRSDGGVVSGRAVFDAAAPLLPGFVQPPAFVF